MPSSRGSSQPRDQTCVSYVSMSLALSDRFFTTSSHHLVAQMVKNLPAMQETQVQSLGWEVSLEEEMRFLLKEERTQYSCLKNYTDRGAWWVAKSHT